MPITCTPSVPLAAHLGQQNDRWRAWICTHRPSLGRAVVADTDLRRCTSPARSIAATCARSAAQAPAVLENFTIRQATAADTGRIAALCLGVFAQDKAAEAFSPPALLTRRPRTQAEWAEQLSQAIRRKAQARVEAREAVLLQEAEEAARQLASLRSGGRAAARHAASVRLERRQAERRRRVRHFACFIAEDRGSSDIVACVALTLARPEAGLPPPFPTFARLRCYASNMAVLEGHRRKGLASALLARCERLAALWRYESLWLHVDEQNEAAAALYAGHGYQVQPSSVYLSMKRQRLLSKQLPRRPPPAVGVQVEAIGGRTADNGVFLWGEGEGAEEP